MRLLAMPPKNHIAAQGQPLIPAKAGIHLACNGVSVRATDIASSSPRRRGSSDVYERHWIPAFAGMTVSRSTDNLLDSFCCVHIPL
jgi:hypothetical protein